MYFYGAQNVLSFLADFKILKNGVLYNDIFVGLCRINEFLSLGHAENTLIEDNSGATTLVQARHILVASIQ